MIPFVEHRIPPLAVVVAATVAACRADSAEAPAPTPTPGPLTAEQPIAAPQQEPEPRGSETTKGLSSSTGSPETTPEPAKPEPKAEPVVKAEPSPGVDGRALYLAKCKGCHGRDGRAETKLGRKHDIPDMTAPEWDRRWPVAKIVRLVTEGKKGTKMKPFRDKLTAEEIEAVADYTRGL